MTLQAKFLAINVPLILVLALPLFTVSEYYAYQNAFNALQTKVNKLVNSQAQALSRPLWVADTRQVDRIIAALQSDSDIIGAAVTDETGALIASFNGNFSSDLSRPDTTSDTAANRPKALLASREIVFVNEGIPELIGNLTLAFSEHRLWTDFRKRIIFKGVLLAILLVAAVISALAANKRIIGMPLKQLLSTIKSVKQGGPRQLIQWRSNDEIGTVIAAFNEMQLQQQRYEVKLKESRDSLEKRVNERTRDLALARDLAEQASRAKGAFLANMSHEIRTPMNAITGMTRLALQTNLTDKQRDYLNKVQAASGSLLKTINSILDFSKIEAGKLFIEKVSFQLDEILDQVATLLGPAAENKDLKLVFAADPDVPATLVGDPLRLGQVLINLTENAVKFTAGGEIVLTVKTIEKHENKVVLQFSVRDTGIGMTEAQQAHLFKAFVQADDSTTRKFGGTGLGLAICHQLVTLMGGAISVTSACGKGTTMAFSLVFEFDEAALAKKHGRTVDFDAKLTGARILLVEDNPINQQIAVELLQNAGVETEVVNNGYEALECLHKSTTGQKPFDAILMDLQMPEMDGYEATRRIRAQAKYANLPIIAMTAHAMAEEHSRCLQAGMNDHIAKPVDPEKLFTVLMQKAKTRSSKMQLPFIERMNSRNELPTELAGINLEDGLRRLNNNGTLYAKLLRDFIGAHGGSAQFIKEKLAAHDLAGAQAKAHALKGTAAQLSAYKLAEAAHGIEMALKQDTGVTDRQLQALISALTEVVAAIRTLPVPEPVPLAQTPSPATAYDKTAPFLAADADAIKQQLDKLADLIAANDLKAETLAEELLRRCSQLPSLAAQLQAIKQSIDQFDFGKALLALKQTASDLDIKKPD